MKYFPMSARAKKSQKKSESYNKYQLSISAHVIKAFLVITGFFNTALLLPDVINLESVFAKILVIVLRIIFTLMTVILYIRMRKIKSFKKMSSIVTIYELIAVFIFLLVFHLYSPPDYTIQLLGAFIIILIVFLIPNRWINMILVGVTVLVGFLLSAYIDIEDYGQTQFIASLVYLVFEIGLCAVFSFFFSQYQRGEYLAKTELRRIYATDPLTQIGNRAKLEEEADKWIVFCSRHGLPLSLVLIDIDNMKKINDQYGHPIGDDILYNIAQIMHAKLRKNDVCIRWGGDEFILLLPHTGGHGAKILTERIRHEMLCYEFCIDVNITCSCGIAGMKDGYGLEQLIRHADAAMYTAKKQGKNNIEIYEE